MPAGENTSANPGDRPTSRTISIARVREIIQSVREAKQVDAIVMKHGAFRWEDDALRNVEQALEFET